MNGAAMRTINQLLGIVLLAQTCAAHAYVIDKQLAGGQDGSPAQDLYKVTLSLPSNPLNDPGDTMFEVNWSVPAGVQTANGVPNPTLTANAKFTVTAFNATTLQLGIDIKNTTVLPPGSFNTNVLSFGFNIDPNATSASATDSNGDVVTWEAAIAQNFPSFQTIDVCVWAANGCTGGNINQGLAAGASDLLTLTLTGNFAAPQGSGNTLVAMISDFPLKFQGTWGSYEVPGNTGCCGGGGDHQVPEPTTLSLAMLGLACVTGRARFCAKRS